jgi:hypothetical protein
MLTCRALCCREMLIFHSSPQARVNLLCDRGNPAGIEGIKPGTAQVLDSSTLTAGPK